MTDEKKCSRHGHDISKSLCPLCAVEAKEGAVANAEADRDHWKKEAEGWRVQFTNAANVADKLKEQLDETKLFSGDIEGALRRAVEEANRTGQAMGAARAAARISAVETERDQAILNAGKCPPRREAVVGKPSTWEEAETGEDPQNNDDVRRRLADAGAFLEDGRTLRVTEATPAPEPDAKCTGLEKWAEGLAHLIWPPGPMPVRTTFNDIEDWVRARVAPPAPEPEDRSEPPSWGKVTDNGTKGPFGEAWEASVRGVQAIGWNNAREDAVARLWKIDDAIRGTPGSTEPSLNTPEPPPTGDGAEVWPLVIADIEERNREGVRKYGTPLRAHNGRKALVDLYQELLDATVYLRQYIEEGTPGSTEP